MSWLARKLETVRAAQQQQKQALEPEPSGFLCPLCNNLDLGTIERLQQHYNDVHSEDPVDETEDGPKADEGVPNVDAVEKEDVTPDTTKQDETEQTDATSDRRTKALEGLLKKERAQVASLKEEIENLKNAKSDQPAENSTSRELESKLELAEKTNADLQKKFDIAEEDLSISKSKVSELAAQLLARPHQEDLEVAQKKISRLQSELEKVKAQHEEECSSLTAAMESLQKDMEQAKEAPKSPPEESQESPESELTELKETVSRQAIALKEKEEQYNNAMSRIANVENQTSDNAQTQGSSEIEDLLRKEIETLKAELESIKEKEKEKEIAKADEDERVQEIATLTRKLSDSAQLVQIKTEECTSLKERLEKQKETLESLKISSNKSKSLEADVAKLNEQLSAKEKELLEFQESNATDSTMVDTLRNELEEQSSKLKRKEAEVEKLQTRNTEVESSMAELKSLIDVHKEERDKLRAELTEGQRLEAEIKKALQEREIATEKLQMDMARAEEKLRAPCEQCRGFGAALDQKSAEIMKLNERIKAMEAQLVEQQDDILHMSEEVDLAKKEKIEVKTKTEGNLQELTKTVEELNAKLEEKSKLYEDLESANVELTAKSVEVSSDYEQIKKKLTDSEKAVQDLEQEKLQLENDMGAAAKKARQAVKDSKAMTQLFEESKKLFIKQKLEIQNELSNTQSMLEAARTELETTTRERDRARETAQTEIAAFKQRADAEGNAKLAAERLLADTRRTLTEEIQGLHENLATLQKQCAAAEAKARELSSSSDALTVDKSALESALQDSQAEKQGLLERCMTGERKLNDLEAKFNTMARTLKERTAALQELGEENQEVIKRLNEVSSRQWVSGRGVKNCSKCQKGFTVARRKHHCRNCGQIFCNDCSGKTAKTTTSKQKVRVCDNCYPELSGK
eukprot:m.339317 g.339317  ORF g.339317 m.339317 type:complete len:920 (+) comp18749_c0_seq1:89-2848(+)